MTNHHHLTQRTGFTLIEIVVAISIFSVILLILVGIFSRFITIQRHEIAEFRLQEDLRLSFELFNREARLAYGSTFASHSNAVLFRNQTGACVTYRFAGQKFQRAEDDSVDRGACPVIVDNQLFQTLHSTQTIFEAMRFTVVPALVSGDGTKLESQGVVTISATARSRGSSKKVPLQNSVSSRQVIPFTNL